MTRITRDEWSAYRKSQRARIAAAYILDLHRGMVRDALSNNSLVNDSATDHLFELWGNLTQAFGLPNLWSKTACDMALTTPWQQALAPFGAAYCAMTAARKRDLEIVGRQYLLINVPDIALTDLINGRV